MQNSAIEHNKSSGFTLLELGLVIALTMIIMLFAIPMGVNFYQSETLDEGANSLYLILERAGSQALMQKNDSSFGVKILSGSYILFQGASYSSRTASQDEVFDMPAGITAGGLGEVVFAKRTGLPSATGAITFSLGGKSQAVSINNQGKIDKQ